MRLLILGDLHLRTINPERRIDDFFQTQLGKMKQVFAIAKKHNCEAILQPGDMWDNPNPSKYAIARYIRLFRHHKIPIYMVIGQHDMTMHNLDSVKKSAVYILVASGCVQLVGLDEKPFPIGGDVWLYGLSFGQTPWFTKDPTCPDVDEKGYSIVMAHINVGSKKLYPDQKVISPNAFQKRYPWADLHVVGDQHYTFQEGTVLNAGCLVRKTIADVERLHKPGVFIHDTETQKTVWEALTIKPWEEVFLMPTTEKKDEQKLLELVEALKANKRMTVSFSENLNLYFKENEVSSEIRKRIEKRMASLMT